MTLGEAVAEAGSVDRETRPGRLLELTVQDLALIDRLRLTLEPGLNVLTGETGAGKSIIVGALSLLLGERASADVIRTGAQKAVVEGVFDVANRKEIIAALSEQGFELANIQPNISRLVQANFFAIRDQPTIADGLLNFP